MKNDKKIISTRALVTAAWNNVRATRKTTFLIVFLGMIVPQMALGLLFDGMGADAVAKLRETFDQRVASGAGMGSFIDLTASALGYLGPMLASSFVILLMIVVSYFALVHVSVRALRGAEPLAAGAALRLGLQSTVPGGLIVLFCLFLLMAFGQVLVAPSVLVAVLSLGVPVILVAEKRGAFRALWDALTLKYARTSPFSGWTVMFVLLSLGAIFYTVVALVGISTGYVMRLDEALGFSRDFWTLTIGHQPFGPIYLFVTTVEVGATMALLGFYPAVTSVLYFTVVGKRPLGAA